jgi:predicted nuclease of restriction endonuclease-like RecB superfamily
MVFEWFKRSAPRNADRIANVRKMATRDRRWALKMMADELNINKETIHQILHEDLRKRKVCAKYVPRRLTDEQKQRGLTSR